MNELLPLENLNPATVFSDGGLDELLTKIDKEARSHVPNLETEKGRKAIASIAAKVAKSKTYLDGLGKELVSGWKQQAKVVDNERKKMRDTLDDLKADVRQPLTAWENAEAERVELIQDEIETLILAGRHTSEQYLTIPLQAMKDRLSEILNDKEPDNLREFTSRYSEVKLIAIDKIKESIVRREKHDADKKELDELRLEKEKRDEADRLALKEKERKERDDRIAKEAKEKAEMQAKEQAKAEAMRVEKEKQEIIKEKERAKADAIKAKEKAKTDAEKAVIKERKRVEAEKEAERLAAEKREANTRHKSKINNQAVNALAAIGIDKAVAKKVVIAIAKSEIPNVSIYY